ncbi:amidohydrolase [Streptomyces sp. JH14]|uniref:amidohydrolase n=1 Tax=Streptomyces sp. JH14 TaxID=2793630 RepID=UPI0023F94FE8|nr:amidohydrolase [Streptomyces sp. JH14]MDF6041765.1 amidohydrolase [Streptomyces sp. JH14]
MADTLHVTDPVDQQCHGVLRTEFGRGTFEARLATAATAGGPPAPGTTWFDTQTGFAVRRWCAPLLDLDPHCLPAGYLARRRELGVVETGRRLLRATGADAREIVRLESLAEQIADTSGTVGSFLANLAEAVHTAAASATAFTSDAAAHHGPEPDPGPPGPGQVRGAAGRWLAGRDAARRAARTGAGGPRTPGAAPDDPVLLRHLLWAAVACGRPLQLQLRSTDPRRLAGFAAATAGLGSDLVLLNSYPYHRHAAQLAHAHPHVYADAGAAPARTGARAAAVLAEILELAPFGKVLFSSGAQGLPELHVVGAHQFREALGRVLGGWVADGAWSHTDATRGAAMIASGNARRVYGLG